MAGSAIVDQSPVEPAPASALPGTPLDPASGPDHGVPQHPGRPESGTDEVTLMAGAVELPDEGRAEIGADEDGAPTAVEERGPVVVIPDEEPISVSHNDVAPPTPGGGTDEQPTPRAAAEAGSEPV
jgi:hypothetical protein